MTITLPTIPSEPDRRLASKKIMIYGPPKIGKTTLASKFENALFFECEPGFSELSVHKVPTYNWEDFLEACRLVAKGEHNFKTIVIDTVDNAFKFCTEHINKKNGVDYEGDLGHGKGWAAVRTEWERVLTQLGKLPYGLVLISHAQDKKIETRTGDFTKTQSSLPDRARNVAIGMVDMILYCDTKSVRTEKGVKVERIICTKPNPAHEAGDRTGRLPDMLPMDYNALKKALEAPPAAINTPPQTMKGKKNANSGANSK